MTKYITEILKELNEDPSLLAEYKNNYVIRTIYEYNYNPEKEFVLPEDAPPFKSAPEPLGMTPGNFYQQVKKLYIFTRKDVSKVRLEQIFIQLLESIHPTEANIVIAIKDGTMEDLYPNITPELLVEHGIIKAEIFPNGVPKSKTVSEPTKGKKLVVNLDDSVKSKESFGKKSSGESNKKITREDLEKMKKKELLETGKSLGIKLNQAKKKSELIDIIIQG